MGDQHGHGARPSQRQAGGRPCEPAAQPWRGDRRGRGREGGHLRGRLRPVRAALGRAGGHAWIHARNAPGGRWRHPPWRLAASRVRASAGPQGHGDPAQGLRRGRDQHELPGPRRRPRVRLAAGRDRDHGRPPGGGDRLSARSRRSRAARCGARGARLRLRGRAPPRRRGRRSGIRRRGDRALGDPGPAHLGADRPGAPMTEDPFVTIARALEEHGTPESPRRVSCYVALGDSFTAGTGSPEGLGWTDRIAASLRGRNSGFVYRNLAVRGATSADVLGELGEGLQLEPDLVTVICGANDVLRSTRPDPSLYARRLTTIFERIQDAGPRVIVITATSPERWDFVRLGPRTRARVEDGMRSFNAVTRE